MLVFVARAVTFPDFLPTRCHHQFVQRTALREQQVTGECFGVDFNAFGADAGKVMQHRTLGFTEVAAGETLILCGHGASHVGDH